MQSLNFIRITSKFIIVGALIPGFSMFAILGLQQLLELFGLECTIAWQLTWIIFGILAIVLPLMFIMLPLVKWNQNRLWRTLIAFLLIEYISIQASLGYFFGETQNLCYTIDGQVGLEYVYTAWLALPILYILSLIITWRYKQLQFKYKT